MLCKTPWWAGSTPTPCGKCMVCRVAKRKELSSRLMLETRVTKESCFLTLTYDDDHLPKDFSLDPQHPKNFLKSFRKELPAGSLRYLLVGEYGGWLYEGEGERRVNPHYHLALLGFNCSGPIRSYEHGKRCFCPSCELVRSVWGKGNIVIEPLNVATANYICGYVLKKMTKVHDPRLEGRYPEFKTSSNGGGRGKQKKGGIGAPAMNHFWDALHDKFTGEIFVGDDVPAGFNYDGKVLPLGRYLRSKIRQKMGYEILTTPKEVLSKKHYEMYDMYEAEKASQKISSEVSFRDWMVARDAGKRLLLEHRVNLNSLKRKTL